jgi:diguanylate cyclase (GGDEF)-like protein
MQLSDRIQTYLERLNRRFSSSPLAAAIASRRLIPLLDLTLLMTALLMLFTTYTVLFFHIVFVLLAFGAFFWKFWGFVLRVLFWVGLTTGVVLWAVLRRSTQPEELVEIPLLSLILVMVYLIASARTRAQLELKQKHAALTVALDERNALQEALVHKAFYDGLTDLPNRELFFDRLKHSLGRAGRRRESIVVLFIDLDDFKSINDRYGHAAGDDLLVEVARRILEVVRLEDTVARLGGDEFTVMLVDQTSIAYAINATERIMQQLFEPYQIDGKEVRITASVGMAQSGPGRDQPDDLVRDADHAMYEAKEGGKAKLQLYKPSGARV